MSEETNSSLSETERNQLQKDIEDAKNSINNDEVSKRVAQAREEAKKEAEKELQLRQEADQAKKQAEELQKKLEESQKSSTEKFEALQKRIDEMATSKAPVKQHDPFADVNRPAGESPVDNLSDVAIDELEKRSAEEFFGADYNRMLNQ